LFPGVSYAHRVRSGFGGLESLRHGERDVLAIITNNIVLERRAPLYTDAFHSLSHDRAEDLSDVRAMKNSSHAWHFFGFGRIELLDFTVGDRRLDGNRIQKSGKVEVGGVLRCSGHL